MTVQERKEKQHAAFKLILSSGGSCRPPEVSPRPHAKFIHYIYLTQFYIHLSRQEVVFVGSLTADASLVWNTVHAGFNWPNKTFTYST